MREGASNKRIAEEEPVTYMKFHKGITALRKALWVPPACHTLVHLRPFQHRLLHLLSGDAGNRTIHWVFDAVGNRGKSVFCNHLVANHGAIILDGSWKDMVHGYEDHRIVIFDIPRELDNFDKVRHYIPFAEKLKNGCLFSGKYDSGQKMFVPPHVIFFSNHMPFDGIERALTRDRLKVHDLSEAKWHAETIMDYTEPM